MSSASDVVHYVVPLMGFERSLVDELRNYTQSRPELLSRSRRQDSVKAFDSWRWSRPLQKALRGNLDVEDEAFHEDWGGSRALAYSASFPLFENKNGMDEDGVGCQRKRLRVIRERNSSFLDVLGDRPSRTIQVVPDPADAASWEQLDLLLDLFGWLFEHPEKLFDSDRTFDVFTVVRLFFVHSLYPWNADRIFDSVICHPTYRERFTVAESPGPSRRYPGGGERGILAPLRHYVVRKKRGTNAISASESRRLLSTIMGPGGGKTITGEDLTAIFANLHEDKRYPDPRVFLHFIPFSELEPISFTDVQNSLGSSDQFSIPADMLWVLWTPPVGGFACSHHLWVEDETLGYAMQNDWILPEHQSNGRVIFSMTPLDKSNLISDLENYQLCWNDCAITSAEGGEVRVLETLPGRRFRNRIANFGRPAAVNHHRALVEAHASGTLGQDEVKQALGLKPRYTPMFELSLRVIPYDQLSAIDWASPLGQGANGCVYASSWTRPEGVLSTSDTGPVDVVVKDITARLGGGADDVSMPKFMKELDTTHASLGADATACVSFYGISMAPDPAGHGERPVLVFQRATRDTARKFLADHLADLSFFDSWKALVDCLGSVATGIAFIHKRGVVHRDLHLNNILVTDAYYNSVSFPHEYKYLISDLGEGKRLDHHAGDVEDGAAGFGSYGCAEFRAPEARGGAAAANFASDAFSFGIIACKLAECRAHVCSGNPPDDILARARAGGGSGGTSEAGKGNVVPRVFREVVSSLLAYDAEERPTMAQATRKLDDLTIQFSEQRALVEWCVWDWNSAVAAARTGEQAESTASWSDWSDSSRASTSGGTW
ncbi:serine/threonine protein kinase [Magnaporthiopsis poae ATCC 64411]|uniref:Serine/threonine protein kinase n=1 Tax=Magnaporthiopsis poae (strain ATCC 64411 / 73-15) TaxID=644358 RepID=A0A0C4E2K7_MAGP6|nr:serine/threonine protein kinase [Magnaporthiopsis poae ATCC 64411]